MLIDDGVSDFCDLVHEHHYLRLKDLGGISEVADIAEAKDSKDSLSSHHWI